MATASAKPAFKGAFSKQLEEMSELIDWLWNNHGLSFVKAGDDKVFAFGGDKHTLVLDESKWDGLIEFITPKGAVTIKPAANGDFEVAGANLDEKAIKQVISEGVAAIRKYYENRYWKTPDASA